MSFFSYTQSVLAKSLLFVGLLYELWLVTWAASCSHDGLSFFFYFGGWKFWWHLALNAFKFNFLAFEKYHIGVCSLVLLSFS